MGYNPRPGAGGGGASNEIDVFVVAGQSNAIGSTSDNSASPTPRTGTSYQYESSGGTIIALDDPLGDGAGAGTGSAWPAFAIAYHEATGRKLCIVQTAVGGTALSASVTGVSGNWSPSGALRAASVSRTQAALTALTSAGYTPRIAGIAWIQGESDGSGITVAQTSKADYITELAALITYFRAQLGSHIPFFIWQIGTYVPGTAQSYIDIQEAQAESVDLANSIYLVHDGAKEFPARSLLEVDGVHWVQAAQNEAGRMGARFIAGVREESLSVRVKNASKVYRLEFDSDNFLEISISASGVVHFATNGADVHFDNHVDFEDGTSGDTGGAGGGDDDAQAIIDAINATDVTLDSDQEDAIQAFVVAVKAETGLWAAIASMHGYVGATADSHAIDWKTPAGTPLSYTGSLIHDASGVTGDTGGGVARLALTPASETANSLSFGVLWSNSTGTTFAAYDGVEDINRWVYLIAQNSGSNTAFNAFNGVAGVVTASSVGTTGFFLNSRTSGSVNKLYHDGTEIGSASGAQGTVSSDTFHHDISAGGAFAFDFVGAGLSGAQITALNGAVVALQSALGR